MDMVGVGTSPAKVIVDVTIQMVLIKIFVTTAVQVRLDIALDTLQQVTPYLVSYSRQKYLQKLTKSSSS